MLEPFIMSNTINVVVQKIQNHSVTYIDYIVVEIFKATIKINIEALQKWCTNLRAMINGPENGVNVIYIPIHKKNRHRENYNNILVYYINY